MTKKATPPSTGRKVVQSALFPSRASSRMNSRPLAMGRRIWVIRKNRSFHKPQQPITRNTTASAMKISDASVQKPVRST